jgi:hypothetical protein
MSVSSLEYVFPDSTLYSVTRGQPYTYDFKFHSYNASVAVD